MILSRLPEFAERFHALLETNVVKIGWFSSGGGIATSLAVSTEHIESMLRWFILAMTAVTLTLTFCLQVRSLRRS